MKDMVKRPQQRYDALFRELRMHNDATNNSNNSNANDATNNRNANNATNANNANNDEMKNELKRYLMELNGSLDPQSHSLSNSNSIELGSAYQ